MSDEIWKPIDGYKGYYEVSNLGRVRSVDRRLVDSAGRGKHFKSRILKVKTTGPKKYAYVGVGLHKCGTQKTYRLHRLVAQAFIPNPDNLPEVDHIDGDKTNNRADNLRWVTPKQNVHYMIESGRYNGRVDEMLSPDVRKNLMPKLRKRVIRDDGVEFESITVAAEALGRTRNAVGSVVGHPTRKCNGHSFKYAD